MNFSDKILLNLYFPEFKSPSTSRFESLFIILTKKEANKSTILSQTISPELIIQGEDKRTSFIIKNIPKNIKKKDIRKLVEKYGNINFLSIIPDTKFLDLLIAYINVINYKSIAQIYMGLRKHTFNVLNKKYNIEISYCNVQGKENLKKIFSSNY